VLPAGKEEAEVRKDVGRNRYFTPEQAIEYGIIDRIVRPREAVRAPAPWDPWEGLRAGSPDKAVHAERWASPRPCPARPMNSQRHDLHMLSLGAPAQCC